MRGTACWFMVRLVVPGSEQTIRIWLSAASGNALQHHYQQFWLDCRYRCRVGFRGQLVSASGIRLHRAAKPIRNGGSGRGTININNRAISLFTAGLNYKFGGWW